ncbi:GIY-YIG nuclease family protein [Streptomyces sp. WM4235]|uniref:GIY-YIG nuclease family protein n=1 Tax=Streptomyces sp. WM4235 TaxID=1415551 RepID=UPI0006B0192B|nr:GIY-YIG nuclease family protein [Streptomyces sp. WM4235]
MPESPERTALYRLYDDAGSLLYVGIALNPERRWRQHAWDHADTWWPLVSAKRLEWFATRPEAEAAEVRAIRSEGPAHNRAHASRGFGQVMLEAADKQAVFKRGHSDFGAVASLMQTEIDSGRWPAGQRLPLQRDLLRRFLITQGTLQRAMLRLLGTGVIADPSGCGHYVAVGPLDRPVSIQPGDLAGAAALLRARLPEADRSELARLLVEPDNA